MNPLMLPFVVVKEPAAKPETASLNVSVTAIGLCLVGPEGVVEVSVAVGATLS